MIFLDTYCLVRMAKDEAYLKELKSEKACTLSINLAELHYILLKNFSAEVADHFVKLYSHIAESISVELVIDAMKWRYKNRKKKFSYADALGYQYALTRGMKFVTGDRSFKGMKKAEIRR